MAKNCNRLQSTLNCSLLRGEAGKTGHNHHNPRNGQIRVSKPESEKRQMRNPEEPYRYECNRRPSIWRFRVFWAAILLAASGPAAAEPTELSLWRHEALTEELEAGLASVRRFNARQSKWRINIETLPQRTYTSAITAAALAGQLPCILDLDQPVVPNFAWSGHLRPLDDILSERSLAALSDGAKGVFKDRIYSVGQFDVVLLLFSRTSELQKYGIRTATMAEPYIADEFMQILRSIKSESPALFPLDVNSKDTGEWISYGFSPWIQSAGGDLIDRRSYDNASGYINGDAAVRVARWYQTLFAERLSEEKTVDNQALVQGRSIFHYTGSWDAKRYLDRFGNDIVFMPPPDFGNGPKVGAGSWHWSISSSCEHPDGAAEFIEFLLSPEEIAAMSDARSLVPTTEAGAESSRDFGASGQLRQLYEYAQAYAVKRPETPGYPKISAALDKAFQDIKHGKNVEEALEVAAASINYDIRRNRGYGFREDN